MLGKRRTDLSIGISYAEDLESVKKIILDAVADIEERVPNETTILFYQVLLTVQLPTSFAYGLIRPSSRLIYR